MMRRTDSNSTPLGLTFLSLAIVLTLSLLVLACNSSSPTEPEAPIGGAETFSNANTSGDGVTGGVGPSIDIEKATNGEDADDPPGPQILVGDPVEWTYDVTNTGDQTLNSVTVTDSDPAVEVVCPRTELAAGESMTCTAASLAELGPYSNEGTATGTPEGAEDVTDSDMSHYEGVEVILEAPAIDIEKYTNGDDADDPPGPSIPVGDPVEWTYEVTNTGDVALDLVTVTDSDDLLLVDCPMAMLEAGESMTCMATGMAVSGPYTNIGTATGTSPEGTIVIDEDSSNYTGCEGQDCFDDDDDSDSDSDSDEDSDSDSDSDEDSDDDSDEDSDGDSDEDSDSDSD